MNSRQTRSQHLEQRYAQPYLAPKSGPQGSPPNGSWQVELAAEDVIAMGVPQSSVNDWVGMFTWTFQDGKAQLDYKGPGGDFICQANMVFVDDVARITYYSGDACQSSVEDIQWRSHNRILSPASGCRQK